MYTEIFVNVDFKDDVPDSVIETVRKVCEKDFLWMDNNGHPSRWGLLFNNGSCYTTNTEVAILSNCKFSGWSLIGKGDIKNYESEIEKFFQFIAPWVVNDFMGYMMYEEDSKPDLVFKSGIL